MTFNSNVNGFKSEHVRFSCIFPNLRKEVDNSVDKRGKRVNIKNHKMIIIHCMLEASLYSL